MPKSHSHNSTQPLTEGRIEKLLSGQTSVILTAVDERFDGVNQRLEKLENQFERLLRTLDKFLKRLTDLEEEFTFLKARLRRVEEKLGIAREY